MTDQWLTLSQRTLVDFNRGRFAFECITPGCTRRGTRWSFVPEELGDGLVTLPNLRCLGCGCEPKCTEQPAWGP